MKDKILFWFGADFTHFFLSHYLQKKLDADFYSIIDITQKPRKFFESQNLVNFSKKWFFHDHIRPDKRPDIEYLTKFEEKYNINIWKLAINERIFYRFYDFYKFTDDEILSIEEKSCKFFESVLDEIKPDFFITKEPAFHHLELLYELCLKKGINVLLLGFSEFKGECIISQKPGMLDTIDDFSQMDSGRSLEELQKLFLKRKVSKQIKNYNDQHVNSNFALLNAAFNYLKESNENIKTHYNYFGRKKSKVVSKFLKSSLDKKTRKSFIDSSLLSEVDLNKKYVYFPLAVDLERNLLIDAPFYTNQIEIIRSIVKSLPVGYSLYVKENPAQVSREWRDINEYKEIMNIPNTYLIHPSYPSEKLLEKCGLVITIAGTSAFEATFYNKPALTFTNHSYTILPSINIIKEIPSMPKLIRDSLKIKPDPKDLDKYLNLMDKNSIEFHWMEFSALFKNKFYYQGGLVDVDISEIKIKNLLKECEDTFQGLTLGHLKKIQEMKKNNTNQVESGKLYKTL